MKKITLKNYRTYLLNKAVREMNIEAANWAKTATTKQLAEKYATEQF